mmetsp:Transcript_19273/g.53725  ORF Transcript_19273/g.53725 Transcript_19273/m.53725 type:complete len:227 (+) Transcript_19273:1749-2429(+)
MPANPSMQSIAIPGTNSGSRARKTLKPNSRLPNWKKTSNASSSRTIVATLGLSRPFVGWIAKTKSPKRHGRFTRNSPKGASRVRVDSPPSNPRSRRKLRRQLPMYQSLLPSPLRTRHLNPLRNLLRFRFRLHRTPKASPRQSRTFPRTTTTWWIHRPATVRRGNLIGSETWCFSPPSGRRDTTFTRNVTMGSISYNIDADCLVAEGDSSTEWSTIVATERVKCTAT